MKNIWIIYHKGTNFTSSGLDNSINDYIYQFLDLCTVTMMKVENGKKRGDLQVQFKWVGFYGCCTADLVLASEMSLVEAKII